MAQLNVVQADQENINDRQQNRELSTEVEALLALDDSGDLRSEAATLVHNDTIGSPVISGRRELCGDNLTEISLPLRCVPLRIGGGNGRTHVPNEESAALIDEVGGIMALRAMTEMFYEKAFADVTLDKFIRSHDDPHGERFATWIHQKLGGSGNLWDANRADRLLSPAEVANGKKITVLDRTSAHVAAWNSPKRPARQVGKHFELDECRVWMRLHFWAMRESGIIEKSPSFADYYVRFIGHFVRVYESLAPLFARDSFRWSANEDNLKRYRENGRQMKDVLGLTVEAALLQIPFEEVQDEDWPYVVQDEVEKT